MQNGLKIVWYLNISMLVILITYIIESAVMRLAQLHYIICQQSFFNWNIKKYLLAVQTTGNWDKVLSVLSDIFYKDKLLQKLD